jgi:hypothetical protein
MATGHGYKAKYDYVELTVEEREGQWRLMLRDNRYGDHVEHDETFDTADDAKDVALSLAQNHINVRHNDTLLARAFLTWQEF